MTHDTMIITRKTECTIKNDIVNIFNRLCEIGYKVGNFPPKIRQGKSGGKTRIFFGSDYVICDGNTVTNVINGKHTAPNCILTEIERIDCSM